MSHDLAKKIRQDEELLRTIVESSVLRNWVLLGSVLLLLGIGLGIVLLKP
jgi:hypothetical protein